MGIATGNVSIAAISGRRDLDTPLHSVIARFASALMIEPVVESELVASLAPTQPDAHRIITGSRTMFNMRTGFLGIPTHLTESSAVEESSSLNKKRSLEEKADITTNGEAKKARCAVPALDGGDDICLGCEALISVGANWNVLVKVIRVESEYDEQLQITVQYVIVKPVSAQYGGKYLEYKLDVSEYYEALKLHNDDLIAQVEAL